MKRYTGSCYIGVVGPDTIPVLAATSILNIKKRDGDGAPQFLTATKGYVARQMHINAFMESDHAFLLLLDHDMIFEPDTLERLRGHKLPFVSGYYLRRQLSPMYSVWYKPFSGQWPFENFLDDPQRGELHEIGASGWGCILIHRDVFAKTKDVLKGEMEVIEDDMDVWPYDLAAVMSGKETIRPLRAVKDSVVGSDIRFPFFAAAAGFRLKGDPDVRPQHLIQYPLAVTDYSRQTLESNGQLRANGRKSVQEQRTKIQDALRPLNDGRS